MTKRIQHELTGERTPTGKAIYRLRIDGSYYYGTLREISQIVDTWREREEN